MCKNVMYLTKRETIKKGYPFTSATLFPPRKILNFVTRFLHLNCYNTPSFLPSKSGLNLERTLGYPLLFYSLTGPQPALKLDEGGGVK